ncbi:MAG: hypothetical protein KIT48_02125 [Pseudolabrys sp.]|nr:hypothetical protein [Pseudolabrys sp.]
MAKRTRVSARRASLRAPKKSPHPKPMRRIGVSIGKERRPKAACALPTKRRARGRRGEKSVPKLKGKPGSKRVAMPSPVPAPRRKRGGVVSVPKTYSTELLANGRHRYEQTDEPIAAIAADFRIHPGSLRRLAQRLGWVRFGMAPKQLPVAARLLVQAEQLAAAHADAPASVSIEAIARIEALVLKEIAELEAMRAQLHGVPHPMREAESTARTLTSLTDTLQKLQRLRLPLMAAAQQPDAASHLDTTIPENIDDIRIDLARRIDAFIASRADAGDAQDAAAGTADGA